MPDYAGQNRWDANDALYVTGWGGFLPVWLHRPITADNDLQDLNAGPVNLLTVMVVEQKINFVSIHFSAAVNQTVTITQEFAFGAAWDTVLVNIPLINATDFVWYPDNDIIIAPNDSIRVQCTNAGLPAVNAGTTISMETFV